MWGLTRKGETTDHNAGRKKSKSLTTRVHTTPPPSHTHTPIHSRACRCSWKVPRIFFRPCLLEGLGRAGADAAAEHLPPLQGLELQPSVPLFSVRWRGRTRGFRLARISVGNTEGETNCGACRAAILCFLLWHGRLVCARRMRRILERIRKYASAFGNEEATTM